MKAILPIFLVFFATLGTKATNVQFQLFDPQFGISQTTNRTVIVQAEQYQSTSGGQLLPWRLTQTTDTNGITVFTNLFGSSIGGLYHVIIPGPPQMAQFDIWVSATNLGTVQASSILITLGTQTYPSGAWAWSAWASDQRYQLNGTFLSNTFYPLFSNPSNYTQLPTTTNIVNTLANTNFYVAGANVTLTTNGNVVTIASSSAGAATNAIAIQHGTGNGTTITNITLLAVVTATNLDSRYDTNGAAFNATNNLPTMAFAQTNQFIRTNALPALTNGFVTAAVTNGLSTTNYVQAYSDTNGAAAAVAATAQANLLGTNTLLVAAIASAVNPPNLANSIAGIFGNTYNTNALLFINSVYDAGIIPFVWNGAKYTNNGNSSLTYITNSYLGNGVWTVVELQSGDWLTNGSQASPQAPVGHYKSPNTGYQGDIIYYGLTYQPGSANLNQWTTITTNVMASQANLVSASNTVVWGAQAGSLSLTNSVINGIQTNKYIAGANVTLTTNSGTVTIASSGGGGGSGIPTSNGTGTNTVLQGQATATNLVTTYLYGVAGASPIFIASSNMTDTSQQFFEYGTLASENSTFTGTAAGQQGKDLAIIASRYSALNPMGNPATIEQSAILAGMYATNGGTNAVVMGSAVVNSNNNNFVWSDGYNPLNYDITNETVLFFAHNGFGINTNVTPVGGLGLNGPLNLGANPYLIPTPTNVIGTAWGQDGIGTWVNNGIGYYTNIYDSRYVLQPSGHPQTFSILSNGISLYTINVSAFPGQFNQGGGLGNPPNPIGYFGATNNANGVIIYGSPLFNGNPVFSGNGYFNGNGSGLTNTVAGSFNNTALASINSLIASYPGTLAGTATLALGLSTAGANNLLTNVFTTYNWKFYIDTNLMRLVRTNIITGAWSYVDSGGTNYAQQFIGPLNGTAALANALTNFSQNHILYVDSLIGKDPGIKGDITHPWLTVTNAELSATNGDLIYCGPGWYSNWNSGAGTASIGPQNGVTISGSGVATIFGNTNGTGNQNSINPGTNNVTWMNFYGTNIVFRANTFSSTNVSFYNIEIHDLCQGDVWFWTIGTRADWYGTIRNCYAEGQDDIGLTFYNCTFRDDYFIVGTNAAGRMVVGDGNTYINDTFVYTNDVVGSANPPGAIVLDGTQGSNVVTAQLTFLNTTTNNIPLFGGPYKLIGDYMSNGVFGVSGGFSGSGLLLNNIPPTALNAGTTFNNVDIPTNTLGTHGYSGYFTNGVFVSTGTY